MYIIYLHRNKTNGKVYIGLTSRSIKKRWQEHCKQAKYGYRIKRTNYFHQAIVKYGADDWEPQELARCPSLSEAESLEREWISHYRSNDREYGYNLTEGGNVSQSALDPRVRQKISDSISKIVNDPINKKKQSEKMKEWHQENDNPFLGKKHSDYTKKKISQKVKEWHKDHDNPFKGKTHSEETRTQLSHIALDRCQNPEYNHPMLGKKHSVESIKKMMGFRGYFSKITAEKLLDQAKKSKTQLAIARYFECSSANISYLVKRYGIQKEFKEALHPKERPTPEKLLELAMEYKSQKEIAAYFGCTTANISWLTKKHAIREEFKARLAS